MFEAKKLKVSPGCISQLYGGVLKDIEIIGVSEHMPIATVNIIGSSTSLEGEILKTGAVDNELKYVHGMFVQLKPLNGERIYIPSDKALISLKGKSYWQIKSEGEIKLHFYLPKGETIELVQDGEEHKDALDYMKKRICRYMAP